MKSVEKMIAEARKTIVGLTPAEAQRRVAEEGALLVDIRDVRELERDGVLPGAHHAPRGMLEFWVDPQSPYHKPVFAEDREFVFY
jgi:rhodanese-related sulfurtransferase